MKKFISFLVASFISLQMVAGSASAASTLVPLSDITGHKYQLAIEYLFMNKVVVGYDDGTFKPDSRINRAELLKILVGGAGYGKPDSAKYQNCFPDVKNEWFASYVCFAKEKGWVNGYPDGNFRPAKPTNKVEAIKMLMGMNFPPALNAALKTSAYADIDLTQWYGQYFYVAEMMKITNFPGTRYYPADFMTRGEISNNMFRAMVIMDQKVGSFDQVDMNKVMASINPFPERPAVNVDLIAKNTIEFVVNPPSFTGDSPLEKYAYSIDSSSNPNDMLSSGEYSKDFFEKTMHNRLSIGQNLSANTSYTVSFWVINANGKAGEKGTITVKTSAAT